MRARGAVVATLLGVLLMSALYPIRQYVGQNGHVRNLAAEERQLTERISELRQEQGLLLSDDEIERIAREELGMVRPGEVAFAVLPSEEQRRAAAAPTLPRASGDASPNTWYQRWWDALVDTFTGVR